MKAQVINQFGDQTVFELAEVPKPQVKPGYVLVKVRATSVNPIDYKLRKGYLAALTPAFPAILHGDVAGVVEAIGAGVEAFKVGDEVYACAGGIKSEAGALAEYMLVDAKFLALKPNSLSMSETAALPLVAITAWEALFEKAGLKAGQKVLVHAGMGGVGHVAIQLAKWAGAHVYTTVSSPEKAVLAKALGAAETINYKDESVEDYVNRLTNGEGFDVVFDTVGGETLDNSLAAVTKYGQVVTIQCGSSHDLTNLYMKSASLHAVLMLLPMIYDVQRERHGEILKQVAKLVDEGHLKPYIHDEQFELDSVAKAHALLESGQAMGKVIINI